MIIFLRFYRNLGDFVKRTDNYGKLVFCEKIESVRKSKQIFISIYYFHRLFFVGNLR